MSERIVLTFGDATLRESDVALLAPGRWLNDAVIAFAFEFLAASAASSGEVVLVSPASVELARFAGDSAFVRDVFGTQLGVASCGAALFPVNNAGRANVGRANAGSHWSLLAFVARPEPTFLHIDALGDANAQSAREVAEALAPAVSSSSARFVSLCGVAPRQMNGADCGVFVVAFAQAILMQNRGNQEKLTVGSVRAAISSLSAQAITATMRKTIESWVQRSSRPAC